MPGSECPAGLKTSKEGKKEKGTWPSLASEADLSLGQIGPGIQNRLLLPAWLSRKLVSQAPSPAEGMLWEQPGSGGLQLKLSRLFGLLGGWPLKEPSCSSHHLRGDKLFFFL